MSINRDKNLIVSYLTMRKLIGVLGIGLPIIVVLGGFIQNGFAIQGSISGYYYTNMRDVFVGILCGVSFFLISYKGYEQLDNIVSTVSGLSVMGIIIFPTSMYSGTVVKVGIFLIDDNISEYIHLVFGTLFFLLFSFNSIFLFTKHEPGIFNRQKKRRNFIYRTSGAIMVITIVCMMIYTIFLRETSISKSNPVLICETIALLAFGISWLVKGNTIFKDKG
jgi:hypothetical protein